MIIEKITIKSFGQLIDTTMEFSETLNVIEGHNEAGKSTIAAFIRYMLYGFEGTESEGVISERERRVNWETGVAEGSMTVRVKGKRYLINRSTTLTTRTPRPSYKEEASIIDLESGTPAFGKSPAGEVFFGVSADLFYNTAFIGSLGSVRINEDTVKESIENILFSGSERINTQRAGAKLHDMMESLMHENGMGGVIYDLLVRQSSLEEELARSEEDNKGILAKEAELHTIRERRREAQEKKEKLTELDTNYRNLRLIQSFDQLHEAEDNAEEKAEIFARFLEANTRNHFLPDEQYRADLASCRREVNDTYRAYVSATEIYAERRRAIGITKEVEAALERADGMGGESVIDKRAKGMHFGYIRNLILTVTLAVVALFAVVFCFAAQGVAAEPLFRILLGVGGVLSLGGAGVCLYFGLKNKQSLVLLAKSFGTETLTDLLGKLAMLADARQKRDTTLSDIENARVAEEVARENYENAKRALTAVILRWGEEPPASGLNDFLDLLEGKVSAFLERRAVLLHEKELAEVTVKEIRRTLQGYSEIDIRATIPPLRRKALVDINYDDITRGLEECELRIAEQEKLAFDVENELNAIKSRAKDPGELYERIRLLDEQIASLRERHKAYFIARGAIGSASEKLREEISPRLASFSSEMMTLMTDRKYTSLDVTGNLDVTFTLGTGEEKSADYLSGGTLDLTYISVRMALVDMLYTETPPMTFDESFAHQDNVRARAMMRAVKSMTDRGYQSFIFTCRQREASLAAELLPSASVYRLSDASDTAD